MYSTVGEGDHRHEGGAHLERGIALCVLQDVPALVCGNGRSSDAALPVDRLAEVDGHGLGVEVVRKLSLDAGDADVLDTVLLEHPAGDFCACHPSGGRDLRILPELALQGLLDDEAEHHHGNDYEPDIHFFKV